MRRTIVLHLAVVTIVCAINNFRLLPRTNEYLAWDSRSYLDTAESLADGRGFTRNAGATFRVSHMPGYPWRVEPDTFRTPAYPLLIAASRTLRDVIVIQHLMNVALAVALYVFVLSTLSSPAIAFAAALIFAWFPPNAHYANMILTETLFTVLLFATVVATYFAIERRSLPLASIAGLLLGIATLTRPIALYFVIPLALIAFARSRRIVIALIVASLALPVAWIARNRQVSGVATLSTASAENALFQLAAAIEVTKEKSAFYRMTSSQQQLGFRRVLQDEQRQLFLEAMALARADGIDPVAANSATRATYLQRRAVPIIASHPIALVELMVSGILEMDVIEVADIGNDYGFDNRDSESRFIPLVLIAIALLTGGVWRLYTVNATLALLIAVTIGYFSLAAAIPETGIKYALIFAPLYSIGLAFGGAELVRYIRARRLATSGPSYTKPV
jgi:hypothetical protein